jgi:uncharacterized protein YdbL (DUF1318 family)
MTKTYFLGLLSALVLCAAPAFALDLTTAKSSGLVGEQTNGLLGVVGTPTPDIDALIKTVNDGRMKIYTQNAAEQKIPVNQVQAIAAEKLQTATPAGQYIQINGKWVKK